MFRCATPDAIKRPAEAEVAALLVAGSDPGLQEGALSCLRRSLRITTAHSPTQKRAGADLRLGGVAQIPRIA